METLAYDRRGVRGEIGLPRPSAYERDEPLPWTGEGKLKDDADDTVVVVLDLAMKSFSSFKNERLGGFDHGRTLVADVSRRRMFESGLLEGRSAEKLPQMVETDLFADVELEQDRDSPGENGLVGELVRIRHSEKDSTADEEVHLLSGLSINS